MDRNLPFDFFYDLFKKNENVIIIFKDNNENYKKSIERMISYLIKIKLIDNNCNNHFPCFSSSFGITDRGKEYIKYILENKIDKNFYDSYNELFAIKEKLIIDCIAENEKGKNFIGISYNETIKNRIEIIKEVVEKNEFLPILFSNTITTSNNINYINLEKIKESTFGIFDISYVHDKKCNSYHPNIRTIFEAGFMMGSNKDILLICSEEDQERVHFNLKNKLVTEIESLWTKNIDLSESEH